MDGGLELFPENPPVQYVAVKSWEFNSGEFESIHQGHSDYFHIDFLPRHLRETRNDYLHVEGNILDVRGPSYTTSAIIEEEDLLFELLQFSL